MRWPGTFANSSRTRTRTPAFGMYRQNTKYPIGAVAYAYQPLALLLVTSLMLIFVILPWKLGFWNFWILPRIYLLRSRAVLKWSSVL